MLGQNSSLYRVYEYVQYMAMLMQTWRGYIFNKESMHSYAEQVSYSKTNGGPQRSLEKSYL